MPGRQSHGAPPTKKPKPRANTKKRSMNAFSIASHENPENFKIRQHRLGAQEGGNRPGKRRRDDAEEDEEDEEGEPKKQRKGPAKGRFDELDIDHGSDSEGNEWKLGQVDSDDDSDLDSDEAFGESDEERFEGYAFSGSTDKKSKKKSKSRTKDVNLDEDDEMSDSDSELEEGDLGEDAVDLATMLDMAEEEEEAESKLNGKARDRDLSESDEEGSSESDEESSASSADDDDDETSDPAKIAALQRMIANLPQADETTRPSKQRSDGASEYNTPSDFGLTSKTKLTLEDLGLPSINDPHIKKSLKFIESDSKGTGKRKGVTAKLAVPLAKRQQDRLDRSAAYEKSKETLDRWTDTVKHNRRADHLMFPLRDHEMEAVKKNDKLVPTDQTKPFNELEATIQSILEESGLATANGKDDEDHLREFEELETKKMSVEEVKARRDQLRMARELMFREEAKSKRIKKIKSRSYRKVHRKQREKEERLNQEALAEGGFVPSEDEQEAQDRRRATERMGAKHRGSKWAKATKQIGRAAWDEDARDGITDMARRDEDLRKRVEGRAVRKEFEDNSDASVTDSEEDISEDDDAAEQNRLFRQLKKASASELMDESAPGARLSNMKFMRKAEEARKKQNDAMIEDIRRDLVGEDSGREDEEQGDIGRRTFGPNNNKTLETSKMPKLNEFEEHEGSDADGDNMDVEIHGLDNEPRNTTGSTRKPAKGPSKKLESATSRNQPELSSEGGAWSKVPLKSTVVSEAEAKRRRHKKNNAVDVEELDLSKASVIASKPKPAKKSKTAALEIDSESDESGGENGVTLPFAIRDQELIKRAFAGADVVGEFEAEKKQTIQDDDDKIIDNTLPGWGSWTGDGVSKREKARNKGRFLTKVEGVKEQNRKDAKLDRVIISEKRVKKNGKYLASTLPHPFETRQQYERSLRVPVGPEWTTKETYQEATKPRVLLKQGIIAPMSKPLL
ncbi:U3 small nucleolar RNA-associated protein [Lachnellula willkommii]|uniref:U3 small nucleolar RNA-associated protein n=1 Tax=Lachnellula willkommii TaxID=215461 RepID=A0A559M8Y9_9HELO|nr:U3 small nucleolar RNA-associated protein [Lachnellula willkommii]